MPAINATTSSGDRLPGSFWSIVSRMSSNRLEWTQEQPTPYRLAWHHPLEVEARLLLSLSSVVAPGERAGDIRLRRFPVS